MIKHFSARVTLTLLCGLMLVAGAAQAQLGVRTNSGLASPGDSQRPLPVEQAFPFYISAVSPSQFKINWNLPQGHYLYRHAFDFTLSQQADAEELAVDFTLPDGLKKTDQFFGDIEAYYGELDVDIGLGTAAGPDARLYIYYQGCADWGFCYPPQRFEYLLNP